MSKLNFGIECRAEAPFFKNGYVLFCRETKRAAYLDPGDEVERMLEWIDDEGLTLECVLNTHGHLDHISGIRTLKGLYSVPVYLHRHDEELYDSLVQQGNWFGLQFEAPPKIDGYLEDGQIVKVGNLEIKVVHTPGHSPGSVCLVVGDHVFCGDLIFAGSVGRVDLPGGSGPILMESIETRILTLPDETVLLPGHGNATSVGAERYGNPFLRNIRR